jgi:hypothetical protein
MATPFGYCEAESEIKSLKIAHVVSRFRTLYQVAENSDAGCLARDYAIISIESRLGGAGRESSTLARRFLK